MEIPVVLQFRHVHLSAEDQKVLFGNEALEPERTLEHRGQYVARQRVQVIGPDGIFDRVCVLGPERASTQVELSASDAHSIGVKAPLRISGDLDRSASVTLKGPAGEVVAKMSTITPIRHLHLSSSAAEAKGVAQGDVVSVQAGARSINHVVVRIHPTFVPALHISADEAAELWLQSGDTIVL